ncbi:MAG TPA: ATPase, T2SS/T4P/T4SS family, partial [Candidatus Dojkabacteria bacterium]|nr:ATPase, T2SS/T4P/T4SS family [Candidatus Dojkabacteria bacterium]
MVELLKLADDVVKKKINVSNFLDILILDALRKKASDIHIEAKDNKTLLIRYRIDGVLRDIIPLGPEMRDSFLFIIKVRAKLRTDIHFAPQDGKILFNVKKEAIDPVKEEAVKEKIEVKEEKKEGKKKKGKEEEIEEKKEEEIEEKKEESKNLLEKVSQTNIAEKDYYNVDARISIL